MDALDGDVDRGRFIRSRHESVNGRLRGFGVLRQVLGIAKKTPRCLISCRSTNCASFFIVWRKVNFIR